MVRHRDSFDSLVCVVWTASSRERRSVRGRWSPPV